jgi:hypothetical protein
MSRLRRHATVKRVAGAPPAVERCSIRRWAIFSIRRRAVYSSKMYAAVSSVVTVSHLDVGDATNRVKISGTDVSAQDGAMTIVT